MHAGRKSSKSSSSDDDLLLESELGQRKKHFLDYDYDYDGNESHSHVAAITQQPLQGKSSDTSQMNNGNKFPAANHQLESKKKVFDRPSSSKMASSSDQQLSNNNVESVYTILSMFGGHNNSSDIASKFLEFSRNREMCTGKIFIDFFFVC